MYHATLYNFVIQFLDGLRGTVAAREDARFSQQIACSLASKRRRLFPGHLETLLFIMTVIMTPKRIGRYEIERELGHGGMGVVYLGHDSKLNRAVAVKVITPQLLEDKEVRARFVREAQVIAALRHPNIISVYELDEDTETGLPFIAMEYVEGTDLKGLIKSRAFVPFEKKLELMIQVCNGLHYSHERGILHRDVKPSNVLVGREGMLRIVDFGLARIRSSDVTQTGLTLGTPHYMSPEQATGAGGLDGRTKHVFSVGLHLLYELILTLPFQGETPWQIITQILSKPHVSLSVVLPGCADDLVRIVDKALAKEPRDRFAHCSELAVALEQFRNSLPARLADVQLAVTRLRERFQQRSDEKTPLVRAYDAFLFELDLPEPDFPKPVAIDFGPADPRSDYGCLLLLLAGLKDRIERVQQTQANPAPPGCFQGSAGPV